MPAFLQQKRIRFQHCDPAGLVFYPKIFELASEVIEDWFLEWSGYTAYEFHKVEHRSLPTVKTTCEFFDQVRVSDELDFALAVSEVGRSSIQLTVSAARAGKPCFLVSSTLVQVGLDDSGRYSALSFTEAVRDRLMSYADAPPDASLGER
jgi:4-hydroxybenzoyl-CoA thioesterase